MKRGSCSSFDTKKQGEFWKTEQVKKEIIRENGRFMEKNKAVGRNNALEAKICVKRIANKENQVYNGFAPGGNRFSGIREKKE